MQPLVSIIIPTYNRVHLIGETLESVLVQTYKNWECIVVDDSSTDATCELLELYGKRDSRIQYHHRPNYQLKGANSCRNYGFEKSRGQFIIWFDSDDLMTPNHIESKVREIQKKNLDFVVARTQNFRDDEMQEPYSYEKKSYGINVADFVLSRIHWYTYDVILKREVANQICWNEQMKSWQDYNYFCKMLLITENGNYLDKVLTHRRLHARSIQKKLLSTPINFQDELLENRILTFHDIQAQVNAITRKEMIYALMNHCFELAKLGNYPENFNEVAEIVRRNFGIKSTLFFRVSVFFALLFKKGFFILEKAKGKLK